MFQSSTQSTTATVSLSYAQQSLAVAHVCALRATDAIKSPGHWAGSVPPSKTVHRTVFEGNRAKVCQRRAGRRSSKDCAIESLQLAR